MSRRNTLTIMGMVAVTLVAAGVVYFIQRSRQLEHDVSGVVSERLNGEISNSLASADTTGPKLDFVASVDGDVTTLTITVSNPSPNPYKRIILQGFTLGKIEPREKAALPIRLGLLAPGSSQALVLHYDHLAWLGNDVTADRVDTGWAQKPLDVSSSWVAIVSSQPDAVDPNVASTVTEAKGSSNTTGIPISLSEQDARAMKARRDAAVIARAQRDQFSGDWVWAFEYQPGLVVAATAKLVRDGNVVSGTVDWVPVQKVVECKITDGEIDGTKIRFKVTDTEDQSVTSYMYSGTLDGDKIAGRVQISARKSSGGHILTQLNWNAARK